MRLMRREFLLAASFAAMTFVFDVTEMTLYDTWSGAHRRGGCCDVGVMEERNFSFSFGTLKYFALL